jgi:hypothetical protein
LAKRTWSFVGIAEFTGYSAGCAFGETKFTVLNQGIGLAWRVDDRFIQVYRQSPPGGQSPRRWANDLSASARCCPTGCLRQAISIGSASLLESEKIVFGLIWFDLV